MKTIAAAIISLVLAGALTLSAQTPPSQMTSLSLRGAVGQNSGTLISGFIINSTVPKTVMIRGVGPTLGMFGVPDPVAQANISVYDVNGNVVAADDGYLNGPNASTVVATAASVGAFPLTDPGDSALLATLAPGAYTVMVAASGNNPTSGSALLEVYDVDTLTGISTGSLTSGSARGMYGPNTDSLIQGFVISGTANMNLLIRGIGPDLSALGIADPALNVGITVYDVIGHPIASSLPSTGVNPDGSIAADVGDFPLTQPGDSAVTLSLAPGAYTVIATPDPVAPASGIALLQVDEMSAPIPSSDQPVVQSITADSTMLTAGGQTTIHIVVNDAFGNLRFVNLDMISSPGGVGSFGSGDYFDVTMPPNNGWNDIGTDTSTYQRDITLTFPVAGTYVFAGAAMDTQGNYVNYADYPNLSPTLTIVVGPSN
jgi:hypothetical protein